MASWTRSSRCSAGVPPGPSDRWGYRRPIGTERADAVIVGAGLAGSATAGSDGEVPGAVKIGEHGHGTVTTSDGRDGIVSPAARDRVRAFVRERLGGLDPSPVGEVTCLYTSTASEDFILDRHGPFVVCSPCSGHGAKFAPLVGEVAADLACGGAWPDRRFTFAAHAHGRENQ